LYNYWSLQKIIKGVKMTKINSLEDLNRVKEEAIQKRDKQQAQGYTQIIVGMGSTGIAAGSIETLKAILEFIQKEKINNAIVRQTGNIGMDSWEPVVQVITGHEQKVTYGKVTPDAATRILSEHVKGGKIVSEYVIES
jgi:NADP-reducing hydrogenase subunit HndB